MFFVMSRAWDEENILIPHEEWNLRPSDLRSDALPLSHRDSLVSKAHYKVHIWHCTWSSLPSVAKWAMLAVDVLIKKSFTTNGSASKVELEG